MAFDNFGLKAIFIVILICNANSDDNTFPTNYTDMQEPNLEEQGSADLGISEQIQGNDCYSIETFFGKEITYCKTEGFWRRDGCEIIGSDDEGDFYGWGARLIYGEWSIRGILRGIRKRFARFFSGDRRRLNPYTSNTNARWPNGIIPVDRTNYPGGIPEQLWRETVNEYIKVGIQIIDRTNEADYVEIIDGSGCYADVGRIGGRQVISLENPGCLRLNVVGMYVQNIFRIYWGILCVFRVYFYII